MVFSFKLFQSLMILIVKAFNLLLLLALILVNFREWPLVLISGFNEKKLFGLILSIPFRIRNTCNMSDLRLLNFRESSFNVLSLILYGKWLIEVTSLVALRWTFSISSWSDLNRGFHITEPYSKIGLTRALYSGKKTMGSKYEKFLRSIPTLLLAFATISLMCDENFRLLSNVIPKSFSVVSSWISVLFSMYL